MEKIMALQASSIFNAIMAYNAIMDQVTRSVSFLQRRVIFLSVFRMHDICELEFRNVFYIMTKEVHVTHMQRDIITLTFMRNWW